jgi:glycosyltransferase involved in cell wall biosynthesis
MRVLILHNRYRQHGGEDAVAEAETDLLRSRGVEVLRLDADNDADPRVELKGAFGLAFKSHWSNESYRGVREICREFRPDIAHVHNFWLRLTPSVHAACHDAGVPTVQTLHNYRLFCTNAQFHRDGHRCEDCLGRVPWRGVVRRCYKNSLLASAAVARMIVSNRVRGTWMNGVDRFIALSEHSKRLFIEGGIPEDRIRIKPNFVPDAVRTRTPPSRSTDFLCVGRLSEEKGVDRLLSAWVAAALPAPARLIVAGDGPDRASLERQAAQLGIANSVSFLGSMPLSEVLPLYGRARAVTLSSLFHECFPRTLVEAMSAARPVVSSNAAGLEELVSSDIGLQFDPQDTNGCAQALRRMYNDPELADRMGSASRTRYLRNYTPDRNFRMLMDIYGSAMGREAMVPEPVLAGGAVQ